MCIFFVSISGDIRKTAPRMDAKKIYTPPHVHSAIRLLSRAFAIAVHEERPDGALFAKNAHDHMDAFQTSIDVAV